MVRNRAKPWLAAGWDMLVVDEAHHLGWAPETVSPEYALVEALSRQTPGLLLLTATPTQLGLAGLDDAAAEALTSVLIFLNKAYQIDGAGIQITGALIDPVG